MAAEAQKPDGENPTDVLGAQVSSYMAQLSKTLEGGDLQPLREYLGVMARFNNYSIHNQVLILLQCPNATQVAGYQVWKGLGRQVKKGEKGIRILAPLIRKTREDEDEGPKAVYGFNSVAVFDVAQTEGEALPEYRRVGVSGEPPEGLLERVIQACPYLVRLEARLMGEYGATDGKWIWLNASHGPAEQLVTLLHEWAHCLLHFCPDQERPPLQVRELEAEATAYVLASMLGLEARLGCAEYLTGYQVTPPTLRAALKEITRAVKTIRQALGI
jgi:hypothetical protein